MADSPARPEGTVPAWTLLRRFWRFVAPYRRYLWVGMAMIPVVAGMSALRPVLVQRAVDQYLPAGDRVGLRLVAIAFLAAVFLEFACMAVQVYALQRAGHATVGDLRRTIFEHVLRLEAAFFDKNPIGSLLSRTTSDVEAVSETLSFGVVTVITDIVMILAFLAAMLALDVRLTLVALALSPIIVGLVWLFSRLLRGLQLAIRKAQAVQSGHLAEHLAGATIVQLFAREEAAANEHDELGRAYLKATQWANVYDALLFSLMDGIAAMSVALLLYVAAPEVVLDASGLADGVTLGVLFAFVDYLQKIFTPIREFSGKLATLQRAAASLERIYGLLDRPAEDPPSSTTDPLHGFRGRIRVRDLSFGYGAGAPTIVDGVSFDVEPGSVVALVGRTGSGKTTIARLLSGAYAGYTGSIAFEVEGGERVELRSIRPADVRARVLLLQQDVFLFNDTIAFNVSLGAPERAARDRIDEALRVAQAQELFASRGGADFGVGERGVRVSGGEAQLLAFARAALVAPPVLVLDEATASVDSLTEANIERAMAEITRGRTVLVIAHRLSTVRRADQILVLSEGRIVERGRHEDLLARGGMYAELCAKELTLRDGDALV